MNELTAAFGRATRAAATAAAALRGCHDRDAVDRAAVDAMREALDRVDLDGVIVIGEGEKDEAPMLAAGERVGTGRGPALDIAVDPVDGTRCVAEDRPGALVAIGACPRGQMRAPPGFYARKLAGPRALLERCQLTLDALDDDRRLAAALERLAAALGRPPVVAALDRPRNRALLEVLRAAEADARATLRLLPDADLSASVAAALPRAASDIDLLTGVGGCPEAVVSACALACLNGQLICQPWSRDAPDDRSASTLSLDQLVGGAPILFAATGVTGTALVAPGETLLVDQDGARRWAP